MHELLVHGEKLCFDISVEKEKYVFKNFCSKCFKWLFEASCVEEDNDWFCIFDSTSENKRWNRITVEKLIPQACTEGLLGDSQ